MSNTYRNYDSWIEWIDGFDPSRDGMRREIREPKNDGTLLYLPLVWGQKGRKRCKRWRSKAIRRKARRRLKGYGENPLD